MRKTDREITDICEILAIIKKGKICHIAIVDNGKPYVEPMSYGFGYEKGSLTFYFLSPKEGRKIDVLRKNPDVSFDICVEKEIVIDRENACRSGRFYESVIGFGHVEFIEDIPAKCKALTYLMSHQSNGQSFEFDENATSSVCVFKIIVHELTGKRKAPQKTIENLPIKTTIGKPLKDIFLEKGAKFENGYFIIEKDDHNIIFASPNKQNIPDDILYNKDILIIDDDSQFLLMLKAALEIKGYTVETAQNGKIGKKLFSKNEYKVIITDDIMPESDGFEVTLELSKMGKIDQVIAVSGGGRTAPKDYLETFKHFGVRYGFSKPIDLQMLKTVLQHMLS